MAGNERAEPVLPVVQPEVSFSVEEEMRSSDLAAYADNQLERLREVNPAIARYLDRLDASLLKVFEANDDVDYIREAARLGGIVVYRFVESQVAADKLNSQLE